MLGRLVRRCKKHWKGQSGWHLRKEKVLGAVGIKTGLEFWEPCWKAFLSKITHAVFSRWHKSWSGKKAGWEECPGLLLLRSPSLEHRKLTEVTGTSSQDGWQYIYPRDWGAVARRRTALQMLQTVLRSGVQPIGERTQHVPAVACLVSSLPPTLPHLHPLCMALGKRAYVSFCSPTNHLFVPSLPLLSMLFPLLWVYF